MVACQKGFLRYTSECYVFNVCSFFRAPLPVASLKTVSNLSQNEANFESSVRSPFMPLLIHFASIYQLTLRMYAAYNKLSLFST